MFEPNRTAALSRLKGFLPQAGRDYASKRNFDLPGEGHPHVSSLSPYIRHRLITEEEVLGAVLARHSPQAAEKFIAEVCWRTYWKGWLELRSSIWGDYVAGRDRARQDYAGDKALARAEDGRSGVEALDAWTAELLETGYLHNHARMWYASIWIFTLGLPWQLGADLFLRNLIDGDPASNTLGWRWVAGLHTRGKHYLARPDNIAKYTSGRFRPKDLNTKAGPLKGADLPKPGSPPRQDYIDPSLPTAFLLTEEDLSPGYLLAQFAGDSLGHAALLADDARSDAEVAGHVTTFTEGAIADASARWADKLGPAGPVSRDPVALARWAEASGASQIVAPYTPTGPAKTRLKTLRKLLPEKDIQLIIPIRDWDRIGYPRATHGFFRFKDVIPDLLDLTRPDGTGDLFARAS